MSEKDLIDELQGLIPAIGKANNELVSVARGKKAISDEDRARKEILKFTESIFVRLHAFAINYIDAVMSLDVPRISHSTQRLFPMMTKVTSELERVKLPPTLRNKLEDYADSMNKVFEKSKDFAVGTDPRLRELEQHVWRSEEFLEELKDIDVDDYKGLESDVEKSCERIEKLSKEWKQRLKRVPTPTPPRGMPAAAAPTPAAPSPAAPPVTPPRAPATPSARPAPTDRAAELTHEVKDLIEKVNNYIAIYANRFMTIMNDRITLLTAIKAQKEKVDEMLANAGTAGFDIVDEDGYHVAAGVDTMPRVAASLQKELDEGISKGMFKGRMPSWLFKTADQKSTIELEGTNNEIQKLSRELDGKFALLASLNRSYAAPFHGDKDDIMAAASKIHDAHKYLGEYDKHSYELKGILQTAIAHLKTPDIAELPKAAATLDKFDWRYIERMRHSANEVNEAHAKVTA